MKTTQNINVRGTVPLTPPHRLREQFPMDEAANRTVVEGREAVIRTLAGEDPRFLVVVGPCSIHDGKAALDYAARLKAVADRVADRLLIVMRVYFEKPRTTIGWKGLINDPHLDGSLDIGAGLALGRELLLAVNRLGLPAATEMLDPISPQYLADLVTWGSIGARTTESQTHREMASGLSMPIGFKNATDGNLQIALDAMEAARHPHAFLGIDDAGQTCIIQTKGNPWGHLILRGGRSGPNFDAASVVAALRRLEAAGLSQRIVVDCSHANSAKDYRRQGEVFRNVIEQRVTGNDRIIGAMLESNIHPGNQPFKAEGDETTRGLQYGVSITDGCIGWEETEALLLAAHAQLSQLRPAHAH